MGEKVMRWQINCFSLCGAYQYQKQCRMVIYGVGVARKGRGGNHGNCVWIKTVTWMDETKSTYSLGTLDDVDISMGYRCLNIWEI